MQQEEVKISLKSQEQMQQQKELGSLENPSIRARGQNAPDPFSTRDELAIVQTQTPLSFQQLQEMGFQKTGKGVLFRKKETKGNVVGIEVKVGAASIKMKSTSEYLSEGFRTAAIQMRDMLTDLNSLSKMLAKQQFQETSYFN